MIPKFFMQIHIDDLVQFQVNDVLCRRLIAGNGSETLVFAAIGKFESRELISLSCLIEIPTDGQDVNEFVMNRLHQYKGMVHS